LISYVVLDHLDGVAGLAGWRWLYVIFGLFSFSIAIWTFFGLPAKPREAYFLNQKERDLMAERYAEMQLYNGNEFFEWKEVFKALRDVKVYMSAFNQFCFDTCLYSLSVFLPAILKGMGYTTLQANYLTIPVYMLGAFSFILCAYLSDRLVLRSPFILGTSLSGVVGYTILVASPKSGVEYFGTYLCAIGIFTTVGLNVAWILSNVGPSYKRAAAIGVQQSLGNCAGVLAGQIYLSTQAPRYITGNSVGLGAMALGAIGTAALFWYYRTQNMKKARMERDGIGLDEAGDDSSRFRYHY